MEQPLRVTVEVLETRITALENLTDSRFEGIEAARVLFTEALDARLTKLNELRELVGAQKSEFASIDKLEGLAKAISIQFDSVAAQTRTDLLTVKNDIRALQNSQTINQGASARTMQIWLVVIGGVSALSALLTVIHYILHP